MKKRKDSHRDSFAHEAVLGDRFDALLDASRKSNACNNHCYHRLEGER